MENFFRDALAAELERLRKRTLETVQGMGRFQLLWRPPGSDANPIGFLLWHLARREDYHLQTRIGGGEQLWQTEGWHRRFGIDPEATGFGFTAEQVRDFPMPALQDIIAYYSRVRDRTLDTSTPAATPPSRGPCPARPTPPSTLISKPGPATSTSTGARWTT